MRIAVWKVVPCNMGLSSVVFMGGTVQESTGDETEKWVSDSEPKSYHVLSGKVGRCCLNPFSLSTHISQCQMYGKWDVV